jgi:hypothetical protein
MIIINAYGYAGKESADMNCTKLSLFALILVFAALGSFVVPLSHAGTVPIKQIQYVEKNAPFVYEGFDNPNDYNWQGNWDPRSDRDLDRSNNRDRDRGGSSGASAPCRN